MVVDTTLQFAARRNVPVRYDRDLVAATLHAMERVTEVRARRERAFYRKRMAGRRARELADARKLVAENSHLLPRVRGSEARRLRLAAEAGAMDGVLVDAEGVAVPEKSVRVRGAPARMRLRADGELEEHVEDGDLGSGGDGEEDSDDSDGLEGGYGDDEILVD